MEDIIEDTAKTTDVDTNGVEVNEDSSVAVGEEEVKADFTDTQVEEEQVGEEEQKRVQSEEENREFARKRREAETNAKIEQAREQARIETTIKLTKINKYTGKALKDANDVAILEKMQAVEDNGGDPLDEMDSIYKEVYSNKQPTPPKQEQEVEVAHDNGRDKLKADMDDFRKAHPEVDAKALFTDEKFESYCEGKLGKKPLVEIYNDYNRLFVSENKQAYKKAVSKSAVGSLSGQSSPNDSLYTIEQMQHMPREVMDANWDRVERSLAYWGKHKN